MRQALLAGKVRSASARFGTGTILVDPDFSHVEPGATTVTDTVGNVFTLAGGAAIAGTPSIPEVPEVPVVPGSAVYDIA